MDIKDIKSANNFTLHFYDGVYCMKMNECNFFEEFLKYIKEGYIYNIF